jgi:hypothetical protein
VMPVANGGAFVRAAFQPNRFQSFPASAPLPPAATCSGTAHAANSIQLALTEGWTPAEGKILHG